jgi:hypothetical protein
MRHEFRTYTAWYVLARNQSEGVKPKMTEGKLKSDENWQRGITEKKNPLQTNGRKTRATSTYMKQFLSSSVFVMIGVCIGIFNFSNISRCCDPRMGVRAIVRSLLPWTNTDISNTLLNHNTGFLISATSVLSVMTEFQRNTLPPSSGTEMFSLRVSHWLTTTLPFFIASVSGP